MARYTGKSMVVEFDDGVNPVWVFPNVQAVDINPEGGGVERIEGTAAGDAAKYYDEAIPDTPRDVVEISALDESGASTVYKTLAGAAVTAGTLTFYPEGKTNGLPVASATGYMLPPTFGHGYAQNNTVKATFQCDETAEFVLEWDAYTAP
ncbi:MAG: hypothetical protein GX605_11780 [Chloroflexi bacterium]|nr:hypothetical protein [Chloroflexota bacterium]